MAGKSKQMKKLKDHHDYLSRKVAELTEDRKKDRSTESKTLLMRLLLSTITSLVSCLNTRLER